MSLKGISMKFGLIQLSFLCLLCSAAGVSDDAGKAPTVMLISLDGLKPEAILDARTHGLKVPNLQAFMRDGMYAGGVRGVLPTVTYPSHTTLLTGASPAKHGIYSNTTFDPLLRNDKGWYWYAEDIKTPTLWDAAAAAHLKTASIYWPVSVGAKITFNLPQIWRTGTPDDLKLQRALSTPGLEQQLSADLGRYPGGMQETVTEDEIRARFAIRLLELKHPDFLTVYLTGLDTEQHASGPFSPKSNETLERLDAVVGLLRSAAERTSPGRATICVVSDHGFAAVEHDVNLYAAFKEAGLFSVDQNNKVTDWKAVPWPAGGTAAVMLADPADASVRARVKALLDKLSSDPANGIERILTEQEIQRGGGFPDAAYLIALRIGYEIGYSLSLPLVTPPGNLGMHGYLPEHLEMRSSFFMVGPRVPKGRSVGEIDMRQIAPTIADILHIHLAGAELKPVPMR
ncbi:MAG TPA: ectonucleotide pyrophosphatase/phosphodiesterase [Steroidobacteraceae bacterium]